MVSNVCYKSLDHCGSSVCVNDICASTDNPTSVSPSLPPTLNVRLVLTTGLCTCQKQNKGKGDKTRVPNNRVFGQWITSVLGFSRSSRDSLTEMSRDHCVWCDCVCVCARACGVASHVGDSN